MFQEGRLEVDMLKLSELFALMDGFKGGGSNVGSGSLSENAVAFELVFPMVIQEGPLLEEKGAVVLSALAFALADD